MERHGKKKLNDVQYFRRAWSSLPHARYPAAALWSFDNFRARLSGVRN